MEITLSKDQILGLINALERDAKPMQRYIAMMFLEDLLKESEQEPDGHYVMRDGHWMEVTPDV